MVMEELDSVAPKKAIRLAPEVDRILYAKNLPYKITGEDLYDIFGKFGPIRQIRRGNTDETKGSCFVIYDDIYDAKAALDTLSGFNVGGRYLTLHYFNRRTRHKRDQIAVKKEENELLRKMYGVKKDNEK